MIKNNKILFLVVSIQYTFIAFLIFLILGIGNTYAMEYDIGYFNGHLWGFNGQNKFIDTYNINGFYSLPTNDYIESVDMDMKQKLPKGYYYGSLNFTLFKSPNSPDDSSIGLDQITFYYSLNNYSTVTQFQPEFVALNKLNSFYNGTQYQIEYQLIYEIQFNSDLFYRIHISSRSTITDRAWYYVTYNPWGWTLTDELPQDTNDVINNSTNNIINNNNSNTNNIINNQNQNQNQTNDRLDNIDNSINNSSVDNNNVNNTFNEIQNKFEENGVITNLLSLPVTLYTSVLNSLNSNSCTSFNLGTLFGTALILPCFNISDFLGSALTTSIDIMISGFFIYSIRNVFVKIYEKFTSLEEGDILD